MGIEDVVNMLYALIKSLDEFDKIGRRKTTKKELV
jgi:hypothetical protein